MEMIKFEHSVFALPFAYLGLFLAAQGRPSFGIFLAVTLAMVGFRTMAMGLNRLLDQEIDALNPRTKERALPAKKLSRSYVWLWTVGSFLVFIFSVTQLDPRCLWLSPIPVALAVLYPLMKRHTWLSHFILGLVLGIAPYGAWIATGREFSWIPGFLCLGVTAWVAGFDIIYALQDEAFDREQGLHSLPSRFGLGISLWMTRLLHAVTILAWMLAGWLAGLSWIYFMGVTGVILFLLREHWLVRSFGLKKINEAFFTMNAVVSILIFTAALIDTLWGKHLL